MVLALEQAKLGHRASCVEVLSDNLRQVGDYAMKSHAAPLLMAACVSLAASSDVWARKWTDNTGCYSVEADLLEVKVGAVVS
jgi:hypothetical protein